MLLTALILTQTQVELRTLGSIQNKEIGEMSGIARSSLNPKTYWVHNDSGDTARIFAIDKSGNTVGSEGGYLIDGAVNLDWEDIAVDGNTIYIADTGNNLNFRKELTVYAVKEFKVGHAAANYQSTAYRIAWPDQTEFPPTGDWNFDCEALAVRKGTMYFVTKWRDKTHKLPARGGSLYRLKNPSATKLNKPQKLDTKLDFGGWVTACDLSPDGRRLAVLVQAPQQSVWIFDMTKGDKVLSHPLKQIRFKGAKQCEAVCWDGSDKLIVTNEQADLYEITIPD
ncbi:MAG: hypothetical protein WCK51_04325 [Armatimonadota bacterium]